MPDNTEWLPILTELGEKEVARILDRSPDIQSAILEARENFQKAEEEADALKRKGHETE
jgi:hypothetical protein